MRPHDESFASLAHAHPGRNPGGGATYHMKVWTAARSKGQSTRAAASYIERTEGYGCDPESAAELVYTERGHMPGWADAGAVGRGRRLGVLGGALPGNPNRARAPGRRSTAAPVC